MEHIINKFNVSSTLSDNSTIINLSAITKGKYTGRKLGSTQSTAKLLEKHDIVVKKLKKGLSVREIVKITGKSSATITKIKKVLYS